MNRPYRVIYEVNGKLVDIVQLEDLFLNGTVTTSFSRWDLFKMFLRPRPHVTKTILQPNNRTVLKRTMNALHPDCTRCLTGTKDQHGDHAGEEEVRYASREEASEGHHQGQ